ncbi:MAG: dTMP kinase [Gammaproteobacteria bacterium]|nr:dTMP kinase [Gammaproteobacteria bacterium]NND38739.1 dTMP kinase [Pseudomonadales bacterium]NNL11141.1 dTMP kinase [Pseudomonadales bacterium]NNM12203.1 dTMP kinase [Pseudomonadales bacterium]RZV55945.1 MAG: dTMP kinase [Pseudomonadales bacterium]
MPLGKFITLEGMEGAGKSTNLAYLCSMLDAQGLVYTVTREPGGTPLAEEIRRLLLAPREEKMVPLCELLLVFAARAQHIEAVILPALKRGEWVISDRFTDATFAYQGAGRELGTARVNELEQFVQGELRPDLTLFLDVPLDIGMQRVAKRGELDRFEREQSEFFQRVRAAYLARIEADPERFIHIDASRELSIVQSEIAKAAGELMKNTKQA